MSFIFKMPQRESTLLLILFLVYLLTRIPPLATMPFVLDEALYTIMIEEQAANPTLIPTFLGESISWKPMLFFWIYSVFSDLPLPLELVYRLPSFLFGMVSIYLTFRFLRNMKFSTLVSFFTVAVFLFSYSTIYPNSMAYVDSLFYFFMIGSLFFYSENKFGNSRFLASFVFTFAAFFVKHIVALIIPVLALAFFLSRGRRNLSLLFLISLLAVPLAFVVHLHFLHESNLAEELYITEMQSHLSLQNNTTDTVLNINASIVSIFATLFPWLFLSLFGFWKFWRENFFMSLWFLLSVIPLSTAGFMPWYYLPVMPAIAYFAVLTLLKWEGKENADIFFFIFVTVLIIISCISITYVYSITYDNALPQKDAGLFLEGKKNVLILGGYPPTLIAYKHNSEIKSTGEALDFGWILASKNSNSEDFLDFVDNYWTTEHDVVDGSFSGMFIKKDVFYRKHTNIEHFDYFVLVELDQHTGIADANLIYNDSYIRIYEKE